MDHLVKRICAEKLFGIFRLKKLLNLRHFRQSSEIKEKVLQSLILRAMWHFSLTTDEYKKMQINVNG